MEKSELLHAIGGVNSFATWNNLRAGTGRPVSFPL